MAKALPHMTTVRKISELKKAEYNPRALTMAEADEIRASLIEFGFQGVVIVNQHPKRKDVIVGGHQRCEIWSQLGHDEVPCKYVSLDFEAEKKLNLRLNKAQGHWDFDKLSDDFDPKVLEEVGFTNLGFVARDRDVVMRRDEEKARESEEEHPMPFSVEKKKRGDHVSVKIGEITGSISQAAYEALIKKLPIAKGARFRKVLELLAIE